MGTDAVRGRDTTERTLEVDAVARIARHLVDWDEGCGCTGSPETTILNDLEYVTARLTSAEEIVEAARVVVQLHRAGGQVTPDAFIRLRTALSNHPASQPETQVLVRKGRVFWRARARNEKG
jgi:hypothetical protein